MQVAFPSWSASVARTLAIVQPSAAQLRGVTTAVVPLAWPMKAPVEILDYTLDLDAWMEDVDDVIVAASVSVAPQSSTVDLTVIWVTILDGRLTALLSGGVPGSAYSITLIAQTAAGRIASFDASVLINASATAATLVAPPTPILLPSATALLPDGSQLLLDGLPLLLNSAIAAGSAVSPAALAANTLLLQPGLPLVLDGGLPLILA